MVNYSEKTYNQKSIEEVIKKLKGKKIIFEDGSTTPVIKEASFTPKYIRLDFETKNTKGKKREYL